LSTPSEEATTDAGHDRPAWADKPLGILNAGSRYSFGFGSNFYGIWDASIEGAPKERFPATTEGRTKGWGRYLELEPAAAAAPASKKSDATEYLEGPKQRAWGKWVALGIVVAVVGTVVIINRAGNTNKGGAGGGGGGGGNTAHVDITGTLAQSVDLTQDSFTTKDFSTLIPKVDGTWKGGSLTLIIHIANPAIGDQKTRENPAILLTIDVSASLGALAFMSSHAECTITLNDVDQNGMSGSFTCAGLTAPGSTTTLDATGTFAGSA
jgi:hypothetical protein